MKIKTKESSLIISESIGRISLIIQTPEMVEAVLVLAHGAGAGMTHRFMEALAGELAERKIATVRYNFAYLEIGKKRPDPPAIAEKTVERVIEFTNDYFPEVPLFAGGKSFGGRMTTQLVSKTALPFIKGAVLYGFPLHPTGAPSTDRAKHLYKVRIPMLFLQGTKDTLAELPLIEGVISGLPTAKLIKFEGADHSFSRGKVNLIPLLADETAKFIKLATALR